MQPDVNHVLGTSCVHVPGGSCLDIATQGSLNTGSAQVALQEGLDDPILALQEESCNASKAPSVDNPCDCCSLSFGVMLDVQVTNQATGD